jgi:hypothetical protein
VLGGECDFKGIVFEKFSDQFGFLANICEFSPFGVWCVQFLFLFCFGEFV